MAAASLEMETYLRTLLALIAVLALIGAAGWILKQLVARGALPAGLLAGSANRGAPRLAVLEVRPIDARHRLVLVRRDEVEHLLLLGTTTELVVERDIRGGAVAPALPPRESSS